MLRDPAFDRMFADAVDVMRPYLGDAPWLKRFERGVRALFRDEHAEGATSALDVHAGSGIAGPRLSADIIYRAAAKMLDAMGIP